MRQDGINRPLDTATSLPFNDSSVQGSIDRLPDPPSGITRSSWPGSTKSFRCGTAQRQRFPNCQIDDSPFNKTEAKHAGGVSSGWEKRVPLHRSLRSTRVERVRSGESGEVKVGSRSAFPRYNMRVTHSPGSSKITRYRQASNPCPRWESPLHHQPPKVMIVITTIHTTGSSVIRWIQTRRQANIQLDTPTGSFKNSTRSTIQTAWVTPGTGICEFADRRARSDICGLRPIGALIDRGFTGPIIHLWFYSRV